jgi:hypothetical protein
MISAYGLFGTIRDMVRRAVESFDDVRLIDEWEFFRSCLSADECSILCVNGTGEESYLPFLRAVVSDAERRAEYATYPVVVVDPNNSLRGQLSLAEWRALPWTIVTQEEIDHLGDDAIPREAARAALAFLWQTMSRRCKGRRTAESALRVMFRSREPVSKVSKLAGRMGIRPQRLHRRWRATGIEQGLKQLLRICTILGARAAKTPYLKWEDAAAEYGVTKRTLIDMAHREFSCWPGDNDPGGWLRMVREARALVA